MSAAGPTGVWFARAALLPSGPARDVRFEVADGRFSAITAQTTAAGADLLPGVVLPGFANCHSHAFHRALRGRTHAERDAGGTFWTWRERMYALATGLDPDGYLALARAVYAEMALAGITAVGEFHYLHHGPDGRPYADPNAMGAALRAAAGDAGIRLTLIDACYLTGGLSAAGQLPLDDVQRRFADPDVHAWAARVALLDQDDRTRIGVAAHSVRAVPPPALPVVAAAADGRPLHVHLSEQPAENEACLAAYGRTPTAVLAAAGLLGPRTTAVHATHLTAADIAALGSTSTTVCFCPTTERDLADGVGPSRELTAGGSALSLGTDQHVTIDVLGEAQALEFDERLVTHRRGHFTQRELLAALTAHDSLGWPDAGRLAVGARADLVAVRDDTVRTAGADPQQLVFVATAADVDTVVIDGRPVVRAGQHVLGDVGRLLADTIQAVLPR